MRRVRNAARLEGPTTKKDESHDFVNHRTPI
jgi:hypothetical protein